TGAPFNAALAAGLLSINQHHGGAIEDSMRMIQSALARTADGVLTPEQAAEALIADFQRDKRRLPGFGHRVHTADPRTKRLLELAQAAGTDGPAVTMLRLIEDAFAVQSGKRLPVNVDGALAALLLDLNIPPELGNTFFMMARVPGLVAQVYEEKTRERAMRRIHPSDQGYDGPSPRDLPVE
ncbi:MAG TPA: citrate/2-methylcitrate synthase, partial [Aggregatilineales bacterium]|nr:citrate/2-methylcitrate synthase [Aggregatilineales bacterium]